MHPFLRVGVYAPIGAGGGIFSFSTWLSFLPEGIRKVFSFIAHRQVPLIL